MHPFYVLAFFDGRIMQPSHAKINMKLHTQFLYFSLFLYHLLTYKPESRIKSSYINQTIPLQQMYRNILFFISRQFSVKPRVTRLLLFPHAPSLTYRLWMRNSHAPFRILTLLSLTSYCINTHIVNIKILFI